MSRNEIEKNEKTLDVNTKAIISRLKELRIDAYVDEYDSTQQRSIAECELNYYGSFRGDPHSYKSNSIKAKLPNGIEIHIITNSILDRAVISFAAPEASEIYHREDVLKSHNQNCRALEYYPDIACDIGLNNPGSISDIMKHIADAASLREVSYADLITASVQKYIPEKTEEIMKSMLVRTALTEDEIEMLTRRNKNGDIDGYYNPHMTALIPEGETMTKKETTWLVDKVERCVYLKNSLRVIHGKGCTNFQTQEQCANTVKDCQKFLKGKQTYSNEEPLCCDYRRDGTKKYTELVTNKEVIAAALSSDNLEGRNEILSATEKYKNEFLQRANDKYQKDMEYYDSERYIEDLCEEYSYEMEYEGLDVEDVKPYAQEDAGEELQYAERYASSIAVAPVAYIMRYKGKPEDTCDEFEL